MQRNLSTLLPLLENKGTSRKQIENTDCIKNKIKITEVHRHKTFKVPKKKKMLPNKKKINMIFFKKNIKLNSSQQPLVKK